MEHSASEPRLALQVGNLAKYRKPKSWITWGVRTDGFMFRQADLTGEALYHPLKEMVNSNKRRRKGETKWCRVADESVVVMNLQPRKAGNDWRRKLRGQRSGGAGPEEPKASVVAKGRR